MSMINRDIDVVSAEHTSTSSDNDRDSSEYLDDGYEQPYTTLVVTDQVKDDHVYLTTKKKSQIMKMQFLFRRLLVDMPVNS